MGKVDPGYSVSRGKMLEASGWRRISRDNLLACAGAGRSKDASVEESGGEQGEGSCGEWWMTV